MRNKKYKKKRAFAACLSAMILFSSISVTGCSKKSDNNDIQDLTSANSNVDGGSTDGKPADQGSQDAASVQSAYDEYCKELFAESVSVDALSLHYMVAYPENYGIDPNGLGLGEYSYDVFEEDKKISNEELAELETFNYELLNDEQKLTYDSLKFSFNSGLELYNSSYYFDEQLGPTTGIQAQLPILLAEYAFYNKEDIDRYIEVLKAVPDYFGQIAEFEKEKSKAGLFMPDSTAQSIIDQCKTFAEKPEDNFLITDFEDRLKKFVGDDGSTLSDEEIDDYAAKNTDAVKNYVVPAYQTLIDTLSELKGTGKYEGGIANVEGGKEYYERSVQHDCGTTKSIKEIKSLINNVEGRLLGDLTKIVSNNPDAYNNAISNVPEINEKSPEEQLEFLKTAIVKDYPQFPEVNYKVNYVPESLQDFVSPAMYLTPPVDKYDDNVIYINNGGAGSGTDLFTTLAHEGYPGHLYQAVMGHVNGTSDLRKLIGTSGYAEGWAVYVETAAYRYEYDDPDAAAVLQTNNAVTMCLYGLMDIGINYDAWDKEKLGFFLINNFGIEDEETIDSIYDTLSAEPGTYMPYSFGYCEIENMRYNAETALGDKYSLKDFNSFIVNLGEVPYDVLEDKFNEWLAEKLK